jgi:thioredoxin-related protein
MKRFLFSLALLSSVTITAFAQASKDPVKQESKEAVKKEPVHIYNPEANAQADIDAAVAKAKASGKHVLLQVGGNWCIWCIRFHDLVDSTPELKNYINDKYEYVLVNYSPENKNTDVMNKLGNPGRFGYPNFVVLDGDGKVIHIQDSGALERDKEETEKEGKGHSIKKIQDFLQNWTYAAVHAPAK